MKSIGLGFDSDFGPLTCAKGRESLITTATFGLTRTKALLDR